MCSRAQSRGGKSSFTIATTFPPRARVPPSARAARGRRVRLAGVAYAALEKAQVVAVVESPHGVVELAGEMRVGAAVLDVPDALGAPAEAVAVGRGVEEEDVGNEPVERLGAGRV